MATRDVDVTGDPTNLVASHSMVTGTRYTLQNVDSDARIFLRTAAVKPAATMRAFVLAPLADATIRPDDVVGIWLWTPDGDAKAVLDEAA